MSHEEFINRITPTVAALYEQCEKMTVEEFKEFRNDYISETSILKSAKCKKLAIELLALIEEQLFSETMAV